MDNEIKITIKDGKILLHSENKLTLEDMMTVLFTVQLQMLRNCTPPTDDPNFETIRDLLYDQYNIGASNVLYLYAPDSTLRPDLTEEALRHDLEAEDRYMKETVDKLPEEAFKAPLPEQPEHNPVPAPDELDEVPEIPNNVIPFPTHNHIPHID